MQRAIDLFRRFGARGLLYLWRERQTLFLNRRHAAQMLHMNPKTPKNSPESKKDSKFAPPLYSVSRETLNDLGSTPESRASKAVVDAAFEAAEAKNKVHTSDGIHISAEIHQARTALVEAVTAHVAAPVEASVVEPPVQDLAAPLSLAPNIQLLPIEAIMPNPYQPRQTFSDEELDDLAESIAEHELLQAPAVRLSPEEWSIESGARDGKPCFYVLNGAWRRPNPRTLEMDYRLPSGENISLGTAFATRELAQATIPRYELIGGERRLRAVKRLNQKRAKAGQKAIELLGCNVRAASNREMAELALTENAQRTDVSAIEQAKAMRRLIDEFGATNKELKDRAGVSHSKVSNRLRLLELPGAVQALIVKGELSESHGVILAGLKELGGAFIEWYAAKVVAQKIPTKALEKGLLLDNWQDGPALKKARIAVVCDYAEPFDPDAAMKEFPGAFRRINHYFWCFDFPLYERLVKEGRSAKEAANQKRLDEMRAASDGALDGKAPIPWENLKGGEYSRIGTASGYDPCAKACTLACACRGVGLSHEGEPFQLCTDPARYRKLQLEERRVVSDTKRAKIADVVESASWHLGAGNTLVGEMDETQTKAFNASLSRAAALFCIDTLIESKAGILKSALTHTGLDLRLDSAQLLSSSVPLTQKLDMLSEIFSGDLLALTAEVYLLSVFDAQILGLWNNDISQAKWLLSRLPDGADLNQRVNQALDLKTETTPLDDVEEFDNSEGPDEGE